MYNDSTGKLLRSSYAGVDGDIHQVWVCHFQFTM
jgi:hypothetical protein